MLHDALRLIRNYHDLNQTELAQKLNISKSYLSELESGKKTISVDHLNKYASVFNVTVSSLMLFSEKLESNSLSEKTRIYAADKIIKIMDWIVDKEEEKVA